MTCHENHTKIINSENQPITRTCNKYKNIIYIIHIVFKILLVSSKIASQISSGHIEFNTLLSSLC